MRGRLIVIAACLIVAAAAASAVLWRWKRAVPPPAETIASGPAPGAEVTLTGTLRAAHVVPIDAPVSGVLEEFAVAPGDEVYEGQILGRIANDSIREDEHDAQIELERAQARVNALETELTASRLEESRLAADAARARAELARVERIYRRQATLLREGATARLAYQRAEEEFAAAGKEKDRAEALAAAIQGRIQAALKEIVIARRTAADKQADLDAARAKSDSCNLLAPADGLVVRIRKASGDEVQQGFPGLIELARDWSQLELVVEAPDDYTKRIAPGAAAKIMIADLPGTGLDSSVKSVEQGSLVIEFSSPSALIKPGMIAAARFRLN